MCRRWAVRSTRALAFACLVSCAGEIPPGEGAGSDGPSTIGHVERLDPRLDAIVPAGAVLEILARGHAWTEGPVWVPALRSVLYSDVESNAIFRWSEGDSAAVWLQPSGYTGAVPRGGEMGSNGLVIDAEGRLVMAQHGDRRIARLDADLEAPTPDFVTLSGSFEGRRYNSPNDLTLRSNGDVYFTDPPFGLEQRMDDPARELDFQGVFRLTADGTVTVVTDEMSGPNGIAFSPDEATLYVSNARRAQPVIMAYDVSEGGDVTNGRVFFESTGDGLAVDQQGNVYVAGPGRGVLVIAPDGTHLGSIVTTERTSNCTFGDDGSTLYITADMYLLRIRLTSTGVGF